jgi:hypothetical protein
MRWCFENGTHPYADGILQQLTTGEALVPVLWRYEVSAVLAKSQKDGLITPVKIADFLTALGAFTITIDQDGIGHVFSDVHRQSHKDLRPTMRYISNLPCVKTFRWPPWTINLSVPQSPRPSASVTRSSKKAMRDFSRRRMKTHEEG